MTPPPVRHTGSPLITGDNLTISYGGDPVVSGLDLAVDRGDLMIIVGPNGCGKSTLLKTFARVITPRSGQVILDDTPIRQLRGRAVAKRLSLLPQSAIAPDGITVADLVGRGRHPHHTLLRQWSVADERAISEALARTGLTELAKTPVAALSGGQRQRAWVAMVLTQDTELILLDEPTTFLDIAHQYELLELMQELNAEGRTIVAVLHDLNQAARFASRLVVMDEGAIRADGAPADVLTEELVRTVFGLRAEVITDPQAGTPMVVPHVRQIQSATTVGD